MADDARTLDVRYDEQGERWRTFDNAISIMTVNNYPDFLRNLSMPLIGDIDMAAIDVLRDRERGVPRYNEFRRQIGLKPITSFEQLSSDPQLVADLKALYNNDIEMIDTLVIPRFQHGANEALVDNYRGTTGLTNDCVTLERHGDP